MKKLPELTDGDVVRFWNKVQKSEIHGACWLWTSGTNKDGYGTFHLRTVGGTCKDYLAHRVSYFLAHGSFPFDLCVLHDCDTPNCVNPDHLWIGTRSDNNIDRNVKQRANWARGEKHGSKTHPGCCLSGEFAKGSKLTRQQVDHIRSEYKPYATSQRAIAAQYGVHERTIHLILKGKTWR